MVYDLTGEYIKFSISLLLVYDLTGEDIKFSITPLDVVYLVDAVFIFSFDTLSMAEAEDERVVLIAMDGSEYSDYAFECKFA